MTQSANVDNNTIEVTTYPLLPLRDTVVFPYMVVPLFVGRDRSVTALEQCMEQDKQIFLVAQKEADHEEVTSNDLYEIGTVASVLQLLKLPDGTVKALVEGKYRAKVVEHHAHEDFMEASIKRLPYTDEEDSKLKPVIQSLVNSFEQFVKLNNKIPSEAINSIQEMSDPEKIVDSITAQMPLKLDQKQELLAATSLQDQAESLLKHIEGELEILQVEKKIRGRVRNQMEKSQKEYYLNEQMKAIQQELSDLGDEGGGEIEALEKQIKEAGMPEAAEEKALSEAGKLKMMAPMSAEATVTRNYLEWMVSIPWNKRSDINTNLQQAEKVLEREHYGLERIKERILEYLAVQQRVEKMKGPILCFVGPPGVGKTSLGQSIANATGREFTRVSLGGVRDEAEIRGHRRTYIGALPGKIIQKLSKVGTNNPLFMLDELDKMSSDFRGDPASAMLEVLDPEQNHAFNDHYLEVDFDLSDVMFIATANTLDLPDPLLDRMEVLRLSGYTEDEKVNIAKRHLIPKQLTTNGLTRKEFTLSEPVIRDIIRYYTREAGVRNLEREIAKLCRKAVKQLLTSEQGESKVRVNCKNLADYLGVRRFKLSQAKDKPRIGLVTGLAWTQVGGELLDIEASVVAGKGKPTITGQLGDVMQESIHAALTVVKARYQTLGIADDYFENHNFHVHVPEGATPKDGPSAGVGMCTALISAITQKPIRADVAMTGEITLRGEVLSIGGLKEKLLAAHRGRIKHVIIPKDNEKDLTEVPDNIKEDLEIHPVQWIDEVLNLALLSKQTDSASKSKKQKA